jgi:hypothetical protein
VRIWRNLYGGSPSAFTGKFDSDEKLIPRDVIASGTWTSAREGLVKQFELDDLGGFHDALRTP